MSQSVYMIRLTQNALSYYGIQRNDGTRIICFKQKDIAHKVKSSICSFKRVNEVYPELHINLHEMTKTSKSSKLDEASCEVFKADFDNIELVTKMNNIPITMCVANGESFVFDDLYFETFDNDACADMLEYIYKNIT